MSSTLEAQQLFKVDGLVAVVTGGGSGIGKMISQALSINGAASVYILGLPDDPLETIAKEVVSKPSPTYVLGFGLIPLRRISIPLFAM